MIVVSPGAKGRIMMMDRFRHHGGVRRWLPRVTVEEVDDADIPIAEPDDDGTLSDDAAEITGDRLDGERAVPAPSPDAGRPAE
jgi:hypothetical protein